MKYRRAERLIHLCHWPGCDVVVAPRLWGCRRHWFMLPGDIRAEIWATYRPGQEVDKRPSLEYLAAAKSAQAWIVAKERARFGEYLRPKE